MSDTIELLEAIGQDASLRHATAVELGHVLERARASHALRSAVAAGDSTHLSEEFGRIQMHATQSSQTVYIEPEEVAPKQPPQEESAPQQ